MKKSILVSVLLIFCFTLFAQKQKYQITRYEQTSTQLFVCVNHTKKPVYIEHFFTDAERKDTAAITAAIEGLVAELYIKADQYQEPEKFVAKPDKARRFENKIDSSRVAARKAQILLKRKAEKDSIDKVSLLKVDPTIKIEGAPPIPE